VIKPVLANFLKLYSKLLEMNALHEMILHDVILSKRLVSKLWNLFPTVAKKRMDLYVKEWEFMNLSIIQCAREVSLIKTTQYYEITNIVRMRFSVLWSGFTEALTSHMR
jgi:hypothetical protein